MSQGRNRWLLVRSFVVALLVGLISGSVVQTHFNLSELAQLQVELSTAVQMQTYGLDLLRFAPIYGAVFGVSFFLSQLVSLFLIQFTGAAWRIPLCTAGAGLGLFCAFKILDQVLPMPTLIAATRTQIGLLSMLMTAVLSGLVFSLQLQRIKPQSLSAMILALGVVGLQAFHAESQAATEPKIYQTKVLADSLNHPWSIAFLPQGGHLITERSGQLRWIQADGTSTVVAGVPAVYAEGQGGLLDVLLSPDFEQSQQIYLSYACGTRQANHTCVSRARWTGKQLEQLQEVFRSQPAKQGAVHFGGRMVTLPDRTLVLTLGDGFNYREQAQLLDNHFGKIVRFNLDGTVPADNPFVKKAGALPTIYSLGHRNVQGLYFDVPTNKLYAHEHGPRGGDELNLIEPGKNYGWPIATYGLDYTGAIISPLTERAGTEQPLQYWVPSIAISGLTVYHGKRFPQWDGSVFVGALAAKQVQRLIFQGNKSTTSEILFRELGERIRDVRTGPDGALYLLTDSPKGKLIQVTPKP